MSEHYAQTLRKSTPRRLLAGVKRSVRQEDEVKTASLENSLDLDAMPRVLWKIVAGYISHPTADVIFSLAPCGTTHMALDFTLLEMEDDERRWAFATGDTSTDTTWRYSYPVAHCIWTGKAIQRAQRLGYDESGFDSTLGYPGEGPCKCRNDGGLGDLEGDVPECVKQLTCLAYGHFHARKNVAKAAYKQRQGMKKGKKRKTKVYEQCNFILPSGCGEPKHYHNKQQDTPHICRDYNFADDEVDVDDFDFALFREDPDPAPAVRAPAPAQVPLLPLYQPVQVAIAAPLPPAQMPLPPVVLPAMDAAPQNAAEAELLPVAEPELKELEVEEVDLYVSTLGQLENVRWGLLDYVLWFLALFGHLAQTFYSCCRRRIRPNAEVEILPLVRRILRSRIVLHGTYQETEVLGHVDLFPQFYPWKMRGGVYREIVAEANNDMKLEVARFVLPNDGKPMLNSAAEAFVGHFLAAHSRYGDMKDISVRENTRTKIINDFVLRGLQRRQTDGANRHGTLNYDGGSQKAVLVTAPCREWLLNVVVLTSLLSIITLSWFSLGLTTSSTVISALTWYRQTRSWYMWISRSLELMGHIVQYLVPR